MKRTMALAASVVLVGLLGGSAQGRTAGRPCLDPEVELVVAECSKTFMATAKSRSFKALGRAWRFYSSAWVLDGRYFLAEGGPSPCRDFGRYQNLRVEEDSCSGRLIVTVRSAGEPQAVTFEWERLPDRF